jgi:Kef-type K+ transport system membrane component KefB
VTQGIHTLAVATESTQNLTVWLVVLATATIVTLILHRLRLSVIPGYLIAGALIAPVVDRLEGGAAAVNDIADLAILLLMFGIGLNTDTADAKKGMVSLVGIGVISTVGSCLLGFPIALAFGLAPPVAVIVVMALSISSTAAVMRMLQQRGELRQVHGRICFGVLLVQDLLVVVMLAAIPLVKVWADPQSTADPMTPVRLFAMICLTVGGVGLLILLGMAVLPKLMGLVAQGARPDLLLVFSAAIAIGAAVVTSQLGLSPELGAFIAGFLLSSTPFRHQVAGQLAPMRDLFMAIFFTAVGLGVSASIVSQNWWIILLAVACLIVVKVITITAAAWALGAGSTMAVRCGLILAQGGEFGLVVLSAAVASGGLLDETTKAIVVGTIALSLVLTPMLMVAAERAAPFASRLPPVPWLKHPNLSEALGSDATEVHAGGHVIIAGFGPVGRAIADRFKERGTPFVVIELNPRTVEKQARLGRAIVYGDVTNLAVLESAGIDHAAAIVLTMPDDQAVLRACAVVRQIAPDLFIAARMTFMSKAIAAKQIGADYVIAEEIATAEAMATHVIAAVSSDQD